MSKANNSRKLNSELAAQVLKLRDEEKLKWPDICASLNINNPRYARSLYNQAKGIDPKSPALQAALAALPQCDAKRRNGEHCKQRAGHGTDHPGYGHCRLHGGNNPSGKKHAVRLEVAERMARMGEPVVGITPPEALQGLVESAAGHVNFLNGEIQRLSELSNSEAQALLRWYIDERDRLARFAEASMRTGVADAQLRVSQAQVALLGEALQSAMFKAGIDQESQQKIGAALRQELLKLEGETPTRTAVFEAT